MAKPRKLSEPAERAPTEAPANTADPTQPEAILTRLGQSLSVEASEIAGLHLAPCRYCWGADHHYQWTSEREYRDALAAALHASALRPRPDGGFGYRRDARPNPDCPECCGQGVPVVRYADTRDLPAGALDVIETIRPRGDAVEIRFRSKSPLFESYARLARLTADREDSGEGGQEGTGIVVVPLEEAARADIAPLPSEEDADDG